MPAPPLELAELNRIMHAANQTRSEAELFALLVDATAALGFDHFALMHHVDYSDDPRGVVLLQNYPPAWVDIFRERKLWFDDPVLAASRRTTAGFAFSDMGRLIRLTARQREILDHAYREGIADGYTIPINLPGEASGSCTFVVAPEHEVPAHNFAAAHIVGSYMFEAARRLVRERLALTRPAPRLTSRQLDCLVLMARGKTDWEIARILGLREDTVTEHLDNARARYGVARRTELVWRALYDRHLTFDDLIR